ncbi:hypothetical protein K7X08_035059 [Anisodus acutangulus]|uniref:Uncharacterized protein n=1 Tax=Anisodus acutangulus TaxID=402998 RepID=A0A9Q1R282_9SOLA|nr:hypothetical protein K7X08_035059 [Anisodus acutangulus]
MLVYFRLESLLYAVLPCIFARDCFHLKIKNKSPPLLTCYPFLICQISKRKNFSKVSFLALVMFSSVLHKRLPAEAGISVVCNTLGIVLTNVARDLPQFLQVGFRLIPYFIFNAEEGSQSTLFAATDPQISEYCEMLKADDWPVCAYISHDCRPTNASEEVYNVETSYEVWEKTLELVGLPSDAVERLVEGEEIKCRFGNPQDSFHL